MSLLARYLAPWCFSVAAAALITSPIAAADPALPQPGSEDASQTIADLQSRGYDIQVNWVNGYPRVGLSQCWVNTINMADAPTVWLDIECPK